MRSKAATQEHSEQATSKDAVAVAARGNIESQSGAVAVAADLPLSSALCRHIFLLNSVLQRSGNRACEHHEFTLPQWMALGCIRQEGDSVTHSELGQRLMLSKAPITGVVDRLERAGYVKRATAAHDRRVSRITITAAGREKWLEVRQTLREHAEITCAPLSSAEQETLFDLLNRLLERAVASDPLLAGSINSLECARLARQFMTPSASSVEEPGRAATKKRAAKSPVNRKTVAAGSGLASLEL